MTPSPETFARAAEDLVGTRFRLHGSDPAFGLDCVGLVAAALARCGGPRLSPSGYALRNTDIDAFLPFAARAGLAPATGEIRRGDVLLTVPGPAQHHLAVACDPHRIVHAHAGLRRIVAQPLAPDAPILRVWRLITE